MDKRSSLLLLVVGVFVGCVYGVSLGELTALQDIYSSLDGAGWINNNGWNTGDPCVNKWAGVSCTAATTSGHVQGLNLAKNLLQGELPDSVSNLYALTGLYLDQNSINGSIPDTINGLRAITILSMSYNSLSGSIPDGIGELSSFYSLQELYLQDNNLSGLVPSFFAEDTFVGCDLSNNPFVCPIPQGAEYTKATCINWTITYTPARCLSLSSSSDEPVYGTGFVVGYAGVQCSFSGFPSGTVTTSTYVVSETLLYCAEPVIPFDDCATKDTGLWASGNLTLTLNGESISNSLPISAINSACTWQSTMYPRKTVLNGSTTSFYTYYISSSYKANMYVQIPTEAQAMEACVAGVAKPFRCPEVVELGTSLLPTFDLTCKETDSCVMAPLSSKQKYSPNGWVCPFYRAKNECYTQLQSGYTTESYPTEECLGYYVQSS